LAQTGLIGGVNVGWVSILAFVVCFGIVLSGFRKNADPFSPGRVFGLIWGLSIGLADLKFSGFQHEWRTTSWILLLLAVVAFFVGTFAAYVVFLRRPLMPLRRIREVLGKEVIHESRLFWVTLASGIVYAVAYVLNYLAKGWLPIEAAARDMSRTEFNVTGLTFLIYLVPSVLYFVILYFVKVKGARAKKLLLGVFGLMILISFLLFVSRFQIMMLAVVSFTFFFYATKHVRLRTAMIALFGAAGFFFWISSIRWSSFVAEFLYWSSRMKFPRDYAFLTEPYMYFVMNLENFARAVQKLEQFSYGYYTFDFITAIAGLKYWVYEYFNFERLPFLVSGYNTYTSFWLFYRDFGVIGLVAFPFLLGFGTALLYYRMRSMPSLRNVTAYGVMLFVITMSFFVFPLSFLWFEFNLLLIYVALRWTTIPRTVAA